MKIEIECKSGGNHRWIHPENTPGYIHCEKCNKIEKIYDIKECKNPYHLNSKSRHTCNGCGQKFIPQEQEK